MAWSYSGNPQSSAKDQVRFLIQDTDSKDQQLTDEEIAFLIELEGSSLKAAIKAVETLYARFARYTDESVGQVRVSWSQRADQYRKLADSLKRHAFVRLAAPYAGGISRADKETREMNDDRVEPIFTRQLHDILPGNEEAATSNDEDL